MHKACVCEDKKVERERERATHMNLTETVILPNDVFLLRKYDNTHHNSQFDC